MNNTIKVWIVEDEAIIAQNLQFTLEDLGYKVLGQSYDYESGLEAIQNETFDLMLLDINLSEKNREHNGLALAAILKKHHRVPFIFLTAYSDKQTIAEAAALQPSGYLIKPANAATLFAAIQVAIENHTTKTAAQLPAQPFVRQNPEFFFSKIGATMHKVYWKDVAKLEAHKNYVSIKTFDSSKEYLIRGSLVQVIQNTVPIDMQPLFVRINRAVYLQRAAILEIYLDSVLSPFGIINSTEEAITAIKL
jgi:two-component system, LytTR family, response regulator LytT